MYNQPASREKLDSVAQKLTANGMPASVCTNKEEALAHILNMIPVESEVMTMTSATLQTLGLLEAFAARGQNLVRTKLADPAIDAKTKRQLGAAPDISIASAHAVTEAGEIMIASGTGSQMAAVVYGAGQAILVIGNQKIVKDIDEGMKRIYEYILPIESERLNKALNITTGSSVNKILIIKKEYQPGRIQVVLVEEALGF